MAGLLETFDSFRLSKFTSDFHNSTYPSIDPTRPELSAAGKTILITGGGRGVGKAIVKAFAEAGASHIIITGRSAGSLEAVAVSTRDAHPSTKVSTVTGDVSVEEDVTQIFKHVKSIAPNGVDVVIANAGYLPEVRPIPPARGSDDVDASKAITADWWHAFEVNIKGVYLLARNFLASATGPGAAFVNISAPASHILPVLPGFSPYAGSKLGAARVVETLQLENKDSGLRFYNVHPGTIRSDMLNKTKLEENLDSALQLDDDILPGHFLVWVTSPEGVFLKGKFLWSNWDVDDLKARKEELENPKKLVTGLIGWA